MDNMGLELWPHIYSVRVSVVKSIDVDSHYCIWEQIRLIHCYRPAHWIFDWPVRNGFKTLWFL